MTSIGDITGKKNFVDIGGEEYEAIVVDEGVNAKLIMPGYSGEADLNVLMPQAPFYGTLPEEKDPIKWVERGEWYTIEKIRRDLGEAWILLECTLAKRSEG